MGGLDVAVCILLYKDSQTDRLGLGGGRPLSRPMAMRECGKALPHSVLAVTSHHAGLGRGLELELELELQRRTVVVVDIRLNPWCNTNQSNQHPVRSLAHGRGLAEERFSVLIDSFTTTSSPNKRRERLVGASRNAAWPTGMSPTRCLLRVRWFDSRHQMLHWEVGPFPHSPIP